MSTKPAVDWSKHAEWPKPTITCRCGAIYRSHNKLTNFNGGLVSVTQEPCPGCGAEYDHVKRAEHPPEQWSIQR